jgi:hypothetical protein
MNFKTYEKSGHALDFDLLTISSYICVSYPLRSSVVRKSDQFRPTYLQVSVPTFNTTIIWTPLFEWYVVTCGSKGGHQKDIICVKEIGLRAQNMLIMLRSIVSMVWGLI